MDMKTIYITTKTLSELRKKLPWAFMLNDEGKPIPRSTHDFSIDVIGDLYNDDGNWDDDGKQIKAPTKLAGFHTNIKCNEEFELKIPQSIQVIPTKPKREFA